MHAGSKQTQSNVVSTDMFRRLTNCRIIIIIIK